MQNGEWKFEVWCVHMNICELAIVWVYLKCVNHLENVLSLSLKGMKANEGRESYEKGRKKILKKKFVFYFVSNWNKRILILETNLNQRPE